MASHNVVQPIPVVGRLSEQQCQDILQNIASAADTALHFARRALGVSDSNCGAELEAICLILERIGFLADRASGENVVGDYGRWMLGPDFHERGKEVPHG